MQKITPSITTSEPEDGPEGPRRETDPMSDIEEGSMQKRMSVDGYSSRRLSIDALAEMASSRSLKDVIHKKSRWQTFWAKCCAEYPIPPRHHVRQPISETLISGILSFLGVIVLAVLDYMRYEESNRDITLLTGALGATAVLAFDSYKSYLSQPRNIFFGHVVSASVGMCVRYAFGDHGDEFDAERYWIECPVAVCCAITIMNLLNVMHPPGGATALIAVIGDRSIRQLGLRYISSVGASALITIAMAVLGNNIIPSRQYPLYWW